MTVRLYKSTDASAPVLSGVVGSLVALLDAVLVNGYGALSAAGWTKPYTATNKAVFRNDSSTGTGFYLDVDDAAPSTAKEARVKGYETMSAVATGTGPFPTVAQMASGLFWRKSNTADSTARPWFILADETVFYLFIENGDWTAPVRTLSMMFGDIYSYKTSDAYRCLIIGRTTENSATAFAESFPLLSLFSGNTNPLLATVTGNYMARGTSALGGSIAVGKHGDQSKSYLASAGILGNSAAGTSAMVYPNPADSGLYMAPVFVHHTGGLRGYLKGIWAPCQDTPLGHGDTFTGTGALAAKSFLALLITAAPSLQTTGEVFLETSNTWS